HHQTRDSKSPGNAGTRASRRSQKKQDHVYFNDDEIPGSPVPVAIPQATQPDPVPSVRDAACPVTRSVPVAKQLDPSGLPPLIGPDLPDPQPRLRTRHH
ncbi:hypothetical protein P4O66_009097, partial [Electrophorus voltai]